MSKDLLTHKLVTTRRFGPGEETDHREEESEERSNGTPEPDVDALKSREDNAVQYHALREDWHELKRRRAETLAAIDEAIERVTSRREALETKIEDFKNRKTGVEACTIKDDDAPEQEELRILRQQLHHTDIELALLEREEQTAEHAEFNVAHMTFSELSKVGMALSWPIVLALLVAAGIIIAGLSVLFGI